MTQTWFWDKIKYIEDLKKYDPTDIWAARKIASEIEKEIYMGVLYRRPKNQSFLDRLPNRQKPKTTPMQEVQHFDISELLKEFE